jgi:hypothetical protein
VHIERIFIMAPAIPTHRPVFTATRLAFMVAVVASASSVYLALGSSKAWAAQAGDAPIEAATCLAAAQHATR